MKRQILTTVLIIITFLNISLNGQELIPKKGTKGKWGYVDKNGKELIPFKFDKVKKFSEELAAVKLNGYWGFIDKKGNQVTQIKYKDAGNFYEGRAMVQFINGKYGYIDITGTVILRGNDRESLLAAERNEKERIKKAVAEAERNKAIAKMEAEKKEIERIAAKEKAKKEEAERIAAKEKSEREEKERIIAKANTEREETERITAEKAEAERKEIERLVAIKAEKEKNATPSLQTNNTNNQNVTITNVNTDVSTNIPITNVKNEKTFVVIIANEHYQERGVSPVAFAINDGSVFKEYCIKTLGIPERNIKYRTDATLNNIRSEIRWITQLANQRPGEINIIFFYAGHGTNDQTTQSAYLLPVDGLPLETITAYKLDELYNTLGNLPTKSVTIFLDACYSGTGRDDRMLAETRGVKIKARQGVPVGNTVVFSAAQGDETAHPFDEMEHGMFTYFLLKKLQETKGDVTFGELGDYIAAQVGWESIVVKGKSQTPMVTPSNTIESNWKNWKLK